MEQLIKFMLWTLLVLGLILGKKPLVFLSVVTLSGEALARFVAGKNIENVLYRRQLSSTRVWPGEEFTLTVEVENPSFWPVAFLECNDSVPAEFTTQYTRYLLQRQTLYNPFRLRWLERVRRHFPMRVHSRGRYFIGPVNLVVTDFLGLNQRDKMPEQRQILLCYPEVRSHHEVLARVAYPQGMQDIKSFLFSDPLRFAGLRDYRPGDWIKHMDWKSTARLNRPVVREFHAAANSEVLLLLNLSTNDRVWEPVDKPRVEWSISVAGSLGLAILEEGCALSFEANDSLYSYLPAGEGATQSSRLLDMLASLDIQARQRGSAMLADAVARVPRHSTLLLVTPRLDAELWDTCHQLADRGVRLKVVYTGDAAENIGPTRWLTWWGRDSYHENHHHA